MKDLRFHNTLPVNFRKGNRAGFTLIELMIAIVILAILGAVAGPAMLRWLDQQSLQNAVFQVGGDLYQAKSLAIRENNACDINFDSANDQYSRTLGATTTALGNYRGGVTFTNDPAGAQAFSNSITFTGRGLSNPAGQVFITNADNLNIYRIQTSGSGAISTSVWNNSTNQWVRY
ncbi:MAG: prepilin-type N-terminal cleavage/methylation domain-containing protein [Desulfatitalea sp.]|nr:prepilin-type N-terminal cleavage/methylation domain-containing protein [Desulfatitalea sp.]